MTTRTSRRAGDQSSVVDDDPELTQPLPIIHIDGYSDVTVTVVETDADADVAARRVVGDDRPPEMVGVPDGDLDEALTDEVADETVTDEEAEAPAPVDPRLRARRVAVRRANARRRRRRRWTVLVVLTAAIAAVAVLFSPLGSVRSISVTGVRELDPASVVSLSGISTGDSMITLDPDLAAERIRESKWVRRVTVDRRLPWSVDIVVNERRLAATVIDETDTAYLVADDGVIIESIDTPPPADAPVAHIPDVTLSPDVELDADVAGAIAQVGALPEWLAPRVTGAIIDPAGRITIALDRGVTLVFGDASDAERKLTAAQALLGGAVVSTGLCQVDVSVAAAPTLRRAPDCG